MEDVETAIEPRTHAGVLRPTAGEDERDLGWFVGGDRSGTTPAIGGAQLGGSGDRVGHDDDTTMGHRSSTGQQRVGDVGDVGVGFALEEGGQPLGRVVDRSSRLTGQHEHLARCRRRRRSVRRSLLDDHVGVGAADTERADAGTARAVGLPGGRRCRTA